MQDFITYIGHHNMELKNFRNPVWADVDKTMIDVEHFSETDNEWQPFTVMVCQEELINNLWKAVNNGELGEIKPLPKERLINIYKNKRNALLESSDWSQLADVDVEVQQKWAKYRTQLRDMTKDANFPEGWQFPEEPK